METDRAAVVRAELPRRYDPPHILWYFGAITAAATASATVFAMSAGARGTYQLLTGLFFAVVFAGGAILLLRRGWRVPGGVLVVATVALVPAVGQAFERLVGVWPNVAEVGLDVLQDFQGALFALALATILAGLIAFRLISFPFVFSAVTLGVVLAAQLAVPALVDRPGPGDRASCLIITGAGLLLMGSVLDSVARRDDAFWWHAVGLFTLGLGFAWYAVFKDADWAWISILAIAGVLLLASGPFERATWTTFGALGVFAAALHYDSDWFGSWRSPALMVAVSLGFILLGMALALYARAWAARLRPQPQAPAPAAAPPPDEPPPPPDKPPPPDEPPPPPDKPPPPPDKPPHPDEPTPPPVEPPRPEEA